MHRVSPRPRFYWIMLALLVIALLASYAVAEGRLREGRATLAEREDARDALVAEIGDLQKQIDFAQTDAYVERVARDELGLLMPGEVRYVSN